MGCLLALLSLAVPRLVLFCLWAFSDYLARALESFWIGLLGFFFLPTTTLAYAFAQNDMDGLSGGGFIVVLIGFLLDIGLMTGNGKHQYDRKQRTA